MTVWSKTTGEALPFQVPKTHLDHPVLGADLTTKKPGSKKKKKVEPVLEVSGTTTEEEEV